MLLQTGFGAFDYDLVDAICTWADENGLPPPLPLALGLQESSLNAQNTTGDGGTSFGAFQIHVPPHAGPPQLWLGVDGTRNAMNEMRGRWQAAFAQAGGWDAWLADPVAFQEAWSPAAQGSIAWDHATAGRRVGQAIGLGWVYLKTKGGIPL